LAAGETGEWIVGIEGLALLFMAITGLVTWWPVRSRFSSGFRIVRGRSLALFWRSAHRAVGAGIAVVLIFSATTGALMIFKDPLRAALGTVAPVVSKPSAKVAEQAGRTLIPIDAIVADAQRQNGGATLRQLRFPDQQGRGVSVYLDAQRSSRALATVLVPYDRYSGLPLGKYEAGQLPAVNEFIDWLYPLHIGAAGGVPMQLLVFIGGIALAVLAISGMWLWYVARRARRKRAR
jgi:uncharacterized iron-regulated membrane protein